MQTPAGKACRYYYEDFNRGRSVQECRLLKSAGSPLPWRPSDCTRCPVPDILNANASPDLELALKIEPRVMGLGRRMTVTASCLKHQHPIEDPYVGCPQCNAERGEALDIFRQALESDGEDD
jgi:hypothetical protein